MACKQILIKLQTISDAPTSSVRTEGQLVHGTGSDGLRTRDKHGLAVKGSQFSTSKVPEGVRLNGTHTRAPEKEFSLWGHYRYRMDDALAKQDAAELQKLAAQATRDFEVYTRRRPAFHESHESAVTELLRYSGVPAIEVAWALGARVAWVRRQRVLHGRDAETGVERTVDQRTARVIELKKNGATRKAIAAEVGISTGQVSNLLNGRTSSHGDRSPDYLRAG